MKKNITLFFLIFYSVLRSQNVIRNYPNITKPIRFNIAPLNADLSDEGEIMRAILGVEADFRNVLRLNLEAGTVWSYTEQKAYNFPEIKAVKGPEFFSYKNISAAYFFLRKQKEKQKRIRYNAGSNVIVINEPDIRVPFKVENSLGIRAGLYHMEFPWPFVPERTYGLNPTNANDTVNFIRYNPTGRVMRGFEHINTIHIGLCIRSIRNSVYEVYGTNKFRLIAEYYFDYIYAPDIKIENVQTLADGKIWKLVPATEFYKTGWKTGVSLASPNASVTLRMEIGSRPCTINAVRGYFALTAGYEFGIKCKSLTKPEPSK